MCCVLIIWIANELKDRQIRIRDDETLYRWTDRWLICIDRLLCKYIFRVLNQVLFSRHVACNAKLKVHSVEDSLMLDQRVDLHTIGCTALIRVVESFYWREITRSLHTRRLYICRNISSWKTMYCVLRLVGWYVLLVNISQTIGLTRHFSQGASLLWYPRREECQVSRAKWYGWRRSLRGYPALSASRYAF